MATAGGKLTAVAIKAASVGKLSDGGGLFLDVRANGSRYWRIKYRHAGKERLLAFGVYPEVTLAEARRRRDAARESIRDRRDPSAERDCGTMARLYQGVRTVWAAWIARNRGCEDASP